MNTSGTQFGVVDNAGGEIGMGAGGLAVTTRTGMTETRPPLTQLAIVPTWEKKEAAEVDGMR